MSLVIVERLANESWWSFQILRVMCSERPGRERLLARYVRVKASRLRMIGEEMRGRPLGRLTYHVLVFQRQLEDFREGKLKVLLDSDLVREWMVGSCTVGE